MEDLLSNPFNTQPPPLDELIRATGFNKDWIMFMYRNFKQVQQRSSCQNYIKSIL